MSLGMVAVMNSWAKALKVTDATIAGNLVAIVAVVATMVARMTVVFLVAMIVEMTW